MSAGLSYQALRCAHQAREAEEHRTSQRRKNLLLLILHHLREEGYQDTASCLSSEASIDVSQYEICDNIDLETIVMDYENFYHLKFSKYPRLAKKICQGSGERRTSETKVNSSNTSCRSAGALPRISSNSRPCSSPLPPPSASNSKSVASKQKPPTPAHRKTNSLNSISTNPHPTENEFSPFLQATSLFRKGNQGEAETNSKKQKLPFTGGQFGQMIDIRSMLNDATRMNCEEGTDVNQQDRLLKPLGGYLAYNSEWRDLAQLISREIYLQNPNLRWDDIIGLDEAKRLVKEAVVYPIKYPSLFQGILSPWKGLLLYGPPGTGKTLLAKAVATVCKTTFFNISASSIVSKWRGDSEKLVRVLFELARFHAPSTIFLDELDSVMSQRGSNGQGIEHEGSRRMKTELLVQMDGLAKTDDLVFLLAASNMPWELDHAMLRRLEKRILVDLPTMKARKAMINLHLPKVVIPKEGGLELLTELDYDLLAKKTEGYSGSDIKLVCKEAAMRPVRKVFNILENHTEGEDLHIKLDTLTTADVLESLERTKPSARGLTEKYAAWQTEFESV